MKNTPTWSKRPGDIARVLDAEHAGTPFLLYRNGDDAQHVRPLPPDRRVTIGRSETCDIAITWDARVSRVHAELGQAGGEWAIGDDGLSRNGTFVNGERIAGRRRLADHDVVRVGRTSLLFRHPDVANLDHTAPADDRPVPHLTPSQRRVLVALCRPYLDAAGFASPATNEDVARDLSLSVDAVKSHLRVLFAKFAVGDLPQNQKRMRLAQLALDSGTVGPQDRPRS